MPDVIGLALDVIAAGVSALWPGAGFGVGIAKQALKPEADRLRAWQASKQARHALAHEVQAWARFEDRHISPDDLDAGMTAAAAILRQKGASLITVASLNLDAARIADTVLLGDPYPQRALTSEGRAVCATTVHVFYRRLIDEYDAALERAAQSVALARQDEILRIATAIWERLDEPSSAPSDQGRDAVRGMFIVLADKRLLQYGYGPPHGKTDPDELRNNVDGIRSELYKAMAGTADDSRIYQLLRDLLRACDALINQATDLINGRARRSEGATAADDAEIVRDVDELRSAFGGVAEWVHREYGFTAAADLAVLVRKALAGSGAGG
ncbi:MAG: hypothetical protein ACOH2F_17295 [Cellulomonas sp.]